MTVAGPWLVLLEGGTVELLLVAVVWVAPLVVGVAEAAPLDELPPQP